MNAFHLARTAYDPTATSVRTPRSIEYEAFARTTRKLKAVKNSATQDFALLVDALHDNRMLWSFMAACVADGANALPPALRAQIFYLAEFTSQHSRRLLKGEGDLNVLIEVNTAMMSGLRGGGGAG